MTRSMTGVRRAGIKGVGKEGRGEPKHQAEKDGEIKGPGPFGSVALMVLKNFRDLAFDLGPGFRNFPLTASSLSGTQAPGGRS
jgi:hypothetical protein